MRPVLRTALCDLLGLEYPVLQSGMGGVAGPELVAEVSRAGGLGILAGLNVPPDELRRRIRRVRELTDRPFGVNLWLHTDLRPPIDPATVPDHTVRAAQAALNHFRQRLQLPAVTTRPAGPPDLIDAGFEVILDERVPLFSTALGVPDLAMVRRCFERSVRVVSMVTTVRDARAAAAAGVDAIVAQGSEAGGHRSTGAKPASPQAASVGTMALVPQIVDAVAVPVIAAGGLADGRGLAAALALGASGILLGTRFVATRESAAAEFWKKALLERDGDETTVTDAFTGLYARALANTFSREYAASGAPVLPALLQRTAASDIYTAAARLGDGEHFPMWSGQSVGLIHDLPGAAEVVEAVVREAHAVLSGLAGRVRLAGRNLLRGRIGRAMVAIRDHHIAAEAVGVNTALYKSLTFGVSALYTGVAGALGAIVVQFVAPDTFNVFLSISFLVGIVVGGLASVSGAIFGAFFIQFVPTYAQDVSKAAPWAIYGVFLILFMYVMPTGVAGFLRLTWRRLRRGGLHVEQAMGRSGLDTAGHPGARSDRRREGQVRSGGE